MTDLVPSKGTCPVCECPDGDHYDWCTPQAREQPPSKDLLTRLRTGYLCEVEGCRCHAIDARSGCQCAEAADEIERLQREIARITGEREPPHCASCSCHMTAPEPEPTHYAFLIKRPRDKEAWPTIFTDRERAIGYPDRASAVVPVCLAQPPVDVRGVDCPACGKPMSEHKGELKPGAVLWCP